ncbi:MAG: DUF393 domain-containing protein [Deltaproteobacteria bacterium]|nr:DUF393 domain-containing protein [Deltaproteobacteria bacterium]
MSWLMLASIQARNPMVLQAGDTLLRMLLFWSIFLPLGACFSIDRALDSSEKNPPQIILSPASFAILMQVCLVYWMGAAYKTGSAWSWSQATAVYEALMLDQFATAAGEYLRQFPALLKWLTRYTYWLEILGPSLMFLPFFTQRLRIILVALMASLHIGFAIHMELGLFSYISVTAWLLFLPSLFWDKIFHRLKTTQRLGLKIYYDRDCGFCRRWVKILKEFLLLPETQVDTAQSDPAIHAVMERENSWVVQDVSGKQHIRFEGIITLFRHSPYAWFLAPLLRLWPINSLGQKFYRWVAGHRMIASSWVRFIKFREQKWTIAGWQSVMVIFLFLCSLWWNIHPFVSSSVKKQVPNPVYWITHAFRLEQKWNMFSPRPLLNDGWYVLAATLKDGTKIDLMKADQKLDFAKPKNVSATYPNQRWRKYMMNLYKRREHLSLFASYQCRLWNLFYQNTNKMEELEINFMLERTLPYPQKSSVKKEHLLTYECKEASANSPR